MRPVRPRGTRSVVLLLTALWIAIAGAGDAFGTDLTAELAARRSRLLAKLEAHTILVAFSAPARPYSRDIDYEFRQDSNLYYLTGIDQPETTLVLMPGTETPREILFIAPRDPAMEHRNGPRLSLASARARSGIDTVRLSTDFDSFVETTLSGRTAGSATNGDAVDRSAFATALDEGRATLAVLEDPYAPPEFSLDPARVFAERIEARVPEIGHLNAWNLIADLRRVKTPFEQSVLRQSVAISSEAQREGMRVARPGAFEYEVEAAIERVFLGRGGLGWSYPSIVGSGPNATILHYDRSRRRMVDGDLLLVDAAASYQFMTGDITRTYPVNGTFTPAQRELYELVLAAQQAAADLARPDRSLSDLDAETVRVLRAGLERLGLITDARSDQHRLWVTHSSVHYIGMDVHDVGDNDAALEEGVAFVIEPGLYIRPEVLDRLPPTEETRALVAAIRPAVERYRDLGVRVEDSFLMTASGPERLSATVPRTVEEVQRFMATRGD